MKVLHIWNTAGVAGFIARAMDQLYGTESRVMMRANCDPFNSTVHGKNYDERAAVFILRCIATVPFYDVIHVHSLEKIIPVLRLLFPMKPIMMHYHGSVIRGLWEEKKKFYRWANEIFVSTAELLEGAPEGVFHIPNVVNERLLGRIKALREKGFYKIDPGVALHDSRWADEEARKFSQVHSYEISEYFRTETEGLSHINFVRKLAGFEAYIDVKRDFPGWGNGEILRAHSLTGLEALYLGLKVIRYDGELIEGFPKRHRAENVVSELYWIYGRYAH